MSNPIIEAQGKAISELKRAIKTFCNSDKMKTRVLPLAIPTGWGKTKIAVESVFTAQYNDKHHSYKPVYFLWPQKEGHVSEVWSGEKEWEKVDGGVVYPSYVGDSIENDSRYFFVNNKFRQTKDRQCRNFKKILKKYTGPVVFVIDEWHTKKIIEEYKKDKKKYGAEPFWRRFLLKESSHPGMKRKLFILLLSATPIATTRAMDESPSEASSVDDMEAKITESVNLFNELTRVGNQNREYNLYKIYPALIEDQVKKLGNYRGCRIPTTAAKKDWIEQYVSFDSTKIGYQNPYADEQKIFVKDSLKVEMLKKLLDTHSKRKFVVFCHYNDVAKGLKEALGDCACFLSDQGKKRSKIIKSFNNESDIYSYRVIILMDRDSQGISLHKSNAWLVHYELSWNPIRIIQRFGRVWRLKSVGEDSVELTCPKAFFIPFSYSSEEEQLNRLKRRWLFLKGINGKGAKFGKKSSQEPLMDLTPIDYEIALGKRLSPSPFDEEY